MQQRHFVRDNREVVATFVAGVALLVWTAALNRFPLIFPDTAPYLGAAYAGAWPLDRSGFYGLMMMPVLTLVDGTAGLWAVTLLQTAGIGAILVITLRALDLPLRAQLLVLTVVAIATSLPWHAAQLMPDAFTGPLVLLTWLVVMRDPTSSGSPLLWFAVVVMAVTHLTHVVLMGVTAAATLAVLAIFGLARRQFMKRAVAVTIAVSLVALIQIAGNGVTLGRWTVAPTGPVFLFARMNEDGLMHRWAAKHCGRDAPAELCEMHARLPTDSQETLWGAGPINSLIWFGGNERWRWVDQMSAANRQAIAEQPISFLNSSARGAAEQFITFASLDDECPSPCGDTDKILVTTLAEHRPDVLADFQHSRQFTGQLPKGVIRAVVTPVATLGLVLLLPMLFWSWRRNDSRAAALLSGVALALVANAALAGALSDVHDRYQSRVVWLAPFAVLVVALRTAVTSRG